MSEEEQIILRAIQKNDLTLVKNYINKGYNFNSILNIQQRVEQIVGWGLFEMFKLLREEAKVDITNYNLLSGAVFSTNTELLKYLIDNNIDMTQQSLDSVKVNVFAATVTTEAREKAKIENLKLLLNKGANPNTFINDAVIVNREATKILIASGASLNIVENNMTSVEFALRRKLNHPLTYSLLPDKSNAIHVAIAENNVVEVINLIEKDPRNINLIIPTMRPPIYTAVEYGRLSILSILYAYGASLAPVSSVLTDTYRGNPVFKESLLHLTCDMQNINILKFLLKIKDSNLNINAIGTTFWRDETCLNKAVSSKNLEMVKILLENGALPNQNFNQITVGITLGVPQIFDLNIYRVLKAAGLNMNIKTKYGTPRDYMLRNGISLDLLDN
jgi:ankyrin repeat protein